MKIPESLIELQASFGASIRTPFQFIDGTDRVEVRVDRFDEVVLAQMLPSKHLSGIERLAVYNQQYWFRLLSVMQEEFPLLEREMGVGEFNRMITTYLDRFPSTSPTLRDLSNKFLRFLEDSPYGTRRRIEIATLERCYIEVFDARAEPLLEITPENQHTLASRPLALQPHVRLFEESWALVEGRRAARRSPELEHIDPRVKPGTWLIYRGPRSTMTKPLDPTQWSLLTSIAGGATLADACERVASSLDEDDLMHLGANIQAWFSEWMTAGIFAANT